MKTKALVVVSTILIALALMAQSATQSSSSAAGDNPKACACCNHDQTNGKAICSGKDGTCARNAGCCKGATCCQGKDGKTCSMMSRGNSGKASCCGQGKCPMMSKDKAAHGCCGG